MDSPPAVRVDTPERWHAISAPIRQRVLMLLEDGRAWTARELAEANGRTPQALYRHLAILEAQGLIVTEAAPSASGPRNAVQRHRLAGPLHLVGTDGPFAAEYARCVERVFRDAARMHGRRPPSSRTLVSSNLVLLTEAEAETVRGRIREVLADVRAQAHRRAADGPRRAHSVVLAFTEVGTHAAGDEDDAG
jgi:hypothetical protein